MKGNYFKRISSLMISCILLLSIFYNVFINVSAENNNAVAQFTYGEFDGVESAVGVNPDDIEIVADKFTLPDNDNALNLYWKNGSKSYKAGTAVSVSELTKDNNGNYQFTALFGNVSLDFDEIDTEQFKFRTNGGEQITDGFFEELNKNSWWGVPSGYANDRTTNTAFGASNYAITKRTGTGETGNYIHLKKWATANTYFNAALFTHSAFDSTDPNSHNSNATGSIDYKYVYFTPGEEYTLTFDYMLNTSGGGEPPYNVSIAFGMDIQCGNAKCGQKTIQFVDGKAARTNVDLGNESGVWKKASVTVKAPDKYTGNDITSARMGISLKVKTGGGCYIDNVKLQVGGTKVSFVYDDVSGSAETLGENLIAFADEEGNITLPGNDNVKNLLWKHGENFYSPGTNLNIKQFGNDLTFKAYFGGTTIDFENICTNAVTLPTTAGNKNKNLFEELSRNPSYWRVPEGISNIKSGSNYGIALGHDRVGIIASVGQKGKGLQFKSENYSTPEYRNSVLFNHNPSTFSASDNITYSYVYFTPNTEYVVEFDYKTTSSVDVAIAFGVNTEWGNGKCGTQSINSPTYNEKGNHITLASTEGEWKHASITVKSPASYTGNNITSARVGIALKDNEVSVESIRYSYLDNIIFYPTTMTYNSAKIHYGSETSEEDSQSIAYFNAKEPFKLNSSILLPGNETINAALRSGTNSNGVWTSSYGKISNLIGWKLLNNDEIFAVQDAVSVKDLPNEPVFTAIYGDSDIDFESVDESFKIFNSGALSYGSDKAKIVNENSNNFVRLEQAIGANIKEHNQIMLFTADKRFAGYNIDSTYKITFKYRRIDNTDKESRIYFSFGTVPYDWRARNRNISTSEVCVTKPAMSEFETVSVVVTSPGKHVYQKGSENYYTRTMGIDVELSDGVIIDIDDIEVKAVGLEGEAFGTAKFDFGASEQSNDYKTMKFAESIILPGSQTPVACTRKGTNQSGNKWTAYYGHVSNQTAWYCTNNKKYYELGEKVDSAEVGKNPCFVAMYENGEVDFDGLADDFNFVQSEETSYSSKLTTLKGDTNKYVNITGGEAQKDTSIQVILFSEPDKFLSYNLGKTYKVTFKYRRNDKTDSKSSLFFAFGATPYDWRASSTCVNRVVIGDTKSGMKDWKTVTAYVTAPNTYEFNSGGSNPQYFYSRTMSIGATFSNGVSIDFDDIKVEAIARDEVAMTFSVPEVKMQRVVIGKVGNKLTIPNIDIDRNTVIEGWYKDISFTTPFKLKAFPEESMVVYGKTEPAKVRYYGFTDYPWDSEINSKNDRARKEHHIIEKGISSDGDGYALKIDNTYDGATVEQQGVSLPIRIKPNTKYLISYDFYYEKLGDQTSLYSEVWFNTTVAGSVWTGHKQHITNTDEYTPAALEEGKWMTGYVYGTTTEFDWSCNLAIFNRIPVGSIRYIDNIVITEIPNNNSIAMFKLGSFQSPKPIVVRKNTMITMPKAKLDSKFAFLNWVLNNDDFTKKTYLLEADTVFTAKTTVKTFGDKFENTIYGEKGLQTFGMDLDWEIYDSKGKSSSNVKSGRYSLHRQGNDLRFGAYCFHHNADITKYSMAIGKIYTVSFWVKVENPVHKLGSIDIASCISLANPWNFSANEFNVIAIEDVADGKWHKATFTFMASGEYLSIVVPGNLSIYIDDLTVEYTPDAPKSENCEFEEYLPAFLTEDGKYVKPDTSNDKLEKFQLVKRTTDVISDGSNKFVLPIVISAVVLACGITLGAILIYKKRKNRGSIDEKM